MYASIEACFDHRQSASRSGTVFCSHRRRVRDRQHPLSQRIVRLILGIASVKVLLESLIALEPRADRNLILVAESSSEQRKEADCEKQKHFVRCDVQTHLRRDAGTDVTGRMHGATQVRETHVVRPVRRHERFIRAQMGRIAVQFRALQSTVEKRSAEIVPREPRPVIALCVVGRPTVECVVEFELRWASKLICVSIGNERTWEGNNP